MKANIIFNGEILKVFTLLNRKQIPTYPSFSCNSNYHLWSVLFHNPPSDIWFHPYISVCIWKIGISYLKHHYVTLNNSLNIISSNFPDCFISFVYVFQFVWIKFQIVMNKPYLELDSNTSPFFFYLFIEDTKSFLL